jgi:hypothetical protein
VKQVLFAMAALLLVGCDDFDWGETARFKEDFHSTYPLKTGGAVMVESRNGSVEITGWEKDTVDVTGTKFASSESALKDLKIDIVSTPDSITIRTVPPSGYSHGSMGAKYIIRVPRKVMIDRVSTSNAPIRIESIDGPVRLRTSNGTVRVTRQDGSLDAETSNGAIEINGQTGGATIRTSNGTVRVDDMRGALEARTSNGAIHIRLSDPEPQKQIKLDTSNGSIDLDMVAIRDNNIRCTTSNGSISLHLPQTVNARLDAHTSNSSITTDFDVTVNGSLSKNRLDGKIGTGGAMIELGTSNGHIKVLKL